MGLGVGQVQAYRRRAVGAGGAAGVVNSKAGHASPGVAARVAVGSGSSASVAPLPATEPTTPACRCPAACCGTSPEKSELAGLPGGAGAGRSKVGGVQPDKTTASSKEDFESGTAPDAEAPTPPPGPPTRRRPLTAVQPDLDRGGHGRVERRLLPAAVAQALQQPLRHVLQRPEQLHRRSLP